MNGYPDESQKSSNSAELWDRVQVHPGLKRIAMKSVTDELVLAGPLDKYPGKVAFMLSIDFGMDKDALSASTAMSLERADEILKGAHIKDPRKHLTFDEIIRIAMSVDVSTRWVSSMNADDLLLMATMSETSIEEYDALPPAYRVKPT